MNIRNRTWLWAAMPLMVAHCAGLLDMVALPIWIGSLVGHYQLTLVAAGALVTIFLAGVALVSATVSSRFEKADHRQLAAGGFALAATSFLLIALRSSLAELGVLHALAGLGVGAGLSVAHGTMGRSPDPHRLFAAAGISLGGFAVVMLGVLPPAVAALGGHVLFIAFALVLIVAAVAALSFPRFDTVRTGEGRVRSGLGKAVWATILGICLMTLVNAMVFSFVEVIGAARAFPHAGIVAALIVMGLLNFAVVAPAAMLLETTLRAQRVVLVGPILQAALAITLTTTGQLLPWFMALALFTGVQIFTHTFAFGLLAQLDRTGRATAATPAMLMTGAALGPILGGVLAQNIGFTAIGLAACLLGATALIVFAQSQRSSAPAASPV